MCLLWQWKKLHLWAVAVSDAAMLAPQEVFEGKGDIKEETELTKEESKRRRANKKRRFKAAAVKRTGKKVQEGALPNQMNVIITYKIEPGQEKLFVDTSYA
ncbi:hypothetical protein S83_032429 [Arachis hypogaea]